MNRLRFQAFSAFLPPLLCFAFAIALQIQITLFKTPDYLGLRINLGDLLVPFAGLGILYTLLRGQSLWPQWTIKHLYIWLGGLTLVLLAALVHTHFTYGEISRWAFVNKFGGWFVLVALLGTGGWLGTNAAQKHLELFLKTFLYFGLLVIALEIFVMVGQAYWQNSFIGYSTYTRYPIYGYMVNRNAFAVLYLAIFALSTCLYVTGSTLLKRWYHPAFYFLMPFFMTFNGSRALIITLCLALAAFAILNLRQPKKIGVLLLSFGLGALLLVAIFHDKKDEIFMLNGRQLNFVDHLGSVIEDEETPFGVYDPSKIAYPGDSMRLTILADAKEMLAMRPVTGSGLGSMLLFQKEKHGQMINLIDCTPLWLLVETGLIGLLAFGAFYIQSARALFSQWRQDEGFIKSFRAGIIATMLCFTVMSLFHEMLYTRFVWVLLGLGLTMGIKKRQNV